MGTRPSHADLNQLSALLQGVVSPNRRKFRQAGFQAFGRLAAYPVSRYTFCGSRDRIDLDALLANLIPEEGEQKAIPKSLCFKVVKRLPKGTDKRILSDELVVLKNKESRANYPEAMRRVRAVVEVDGKEHEMEFLTNNISWSAGSVTDLYRCRWQIEVFFKQIKQS